MSKSSLTPILLLSSILAAVVYFSQKKTSGDDIEVSPPIINPDSGDGSGAEGDKYHPYIPTPLPSHDAEASYPSHPPFLEILPTDSPEIAAEKLRQNTKILEDLNAAVEKDNEHV